MCYGVCVSSAFVRVMVADLKQLFPTCRGRIARHGGRGRSVRASMPITLYVRLIFDQGGVGVRDRGCDGGRGGGLEPGRARAGLFSPGTRCRAKHVRAGVVYDSNSRSSVILPSRLCPEARAEKPSQASAASASTRHRAPPIRCGSPRVRRPPVTARGLYQGKMRARARRAVS